MLEVVLWALLAIIVAGGLCALAVVFLPAGEQIAPSLRDEPVWTLPPDRGLHADDVDTVRLPVALRGYRFAETDLLLDRLAEEIRSRDVELDRLRGRTPETADVPDPAMPEPAMAEPAMPEPALPTAELPASPLAPPAASVRHASSPDPDVAAAEDGHPGGDERT